MAITVVDATISRDALRAVAQEVFGADFVKAVVDVTHGVMAVGGDMHVDEEQTLLEQGSHQKDLWGINLYPDKDGEAFIEFDSMINLRPSQSNRSRSIEDPVVREQIKNIVNRLVH